MEKAGFIPVIVDNSVKYPVKKEEISKMSRVVSMHGNAGIAAAQNAGIQIAQSLGACKIAFFDQDSMADESLLRKLENSLDKLGECVVTPMALNKETKEEYPAQRLNKIGYPIDIFVKGETTPQKADLVISSGMMMTVGVLQKVGNYDEDFFIDFVDLEWCLRCRKAKIPVYIIPDVILLHKIGSTDIQAGEMKIVVHSPVRTYYKVRNSFLMLYKRAGIIFTIRQILPALIHNFLLIFSVKEKGSYLKYYCLGVIHGIFGIRGKYPGGKKDA